MSRRMVKTLAVAGSAAGLVAAAYLIAMHHGGSAIGAPTRQNTPIPEANYAEQGNNPNSPRIVYPSEWMAGNCKVWGGGATEITSAEAAAKGGRVFQKGFETLYSLPNGQCVSLAGPPPHPDWISEELENLPTPRPDPRGRPIIQIDPSNLPPALSGTGQ